MRFARLAAFALWLTIALLAVAGFAAFSPTTAPTTTTSSTIAQSPAAGSDWGSASGRVVALAFTSGLRSAPGLSDLSAEDALISDLLGNPTRGDTTGRRPRNLELVVQSAPPAVPATPTTTVAPQPPTTTTTTPTVVEPPPTTTTTQPSGGRLTEAEALGIISLFFAAEDVDLAMQVSYCESRWDPGATNPSSGAAGLFQHIPRFWAERSTAAGWAGANIYDAHANVAVSAWLVYQGGGWSHWAASQACWG